ncbi:MAG: nucleotide exchange factor GrpE [Deltaproteobacteria bacterium]|nr:nucleotide exchange factor GrpE [Deltaproteobacteria bacterium]
MSKKKKSKDVQPPVEEKAQAQSVDESKQAETVESKPMTVEEERNGLLARLQRLAADYQNYQKRSAKDMDQARTYANESLMKELLSVLDDMERALASAKENSEQDDPLLMGMQMVSDKMLQTLGRFGLKVIEAQGQSFDPAKHLALMQQPSTDVPPMMVLQELQKGYELKDRILRPTSVIVSKEPEEEAELADEDAE